MIYLACVGMALLWLAFDSARKGVAATMRPMPLVVWLTLGQMPLFGVWALTQGIDHIQWLPGTDPAGDGSAAAASNVLSSLDSGYLVPALIAIGLNVISNLCYIQAVRISPLSLTIPILSFTPVFVALIAWPLLGQVPAPVMWIGIGLVVVGTFTLNVRSSDRTRPWQILASIARERGSLWMLGAAIGWSGTTALDRLCLEYIHMADPEASGLAFHGFFIVAGIGLSLLITLAIQRRLRELIRIPKPVTLGLGILAGTSALGMQFGLILTFDVSLIEAFKRGVGMTGSVIVGRLIYAEPITSGKVVGVLLLTVGVLLVVAPGVFGWS